MRQAVLGQVSASGAPGLLEQTGGRSSGAHMSVHFKKESVFIQRPLPTGSGTCPNPPTPGRSPQSDVGMGELWTEG